MVDASDVAVGAVLQQRTNEEWLPVSFYSKKLQGAATRYSTFCRELLAIYEAIKHFRHVLEGRHFHVYTDHRPLTFAIRSNSQQHSPRQLRHLSFIAEFTMDIRYCKPVAGPQQVTILLDYYNTINHKSLHHYHYRRQTNSFSLSLQSKSSQKEKRQPPQKVRMLLYIK